MTTADQRAAALAKANHIRTTRATLLQTIRTQPRQQATNTIHNTIHNPPPETIGMEVNRLLQAIPGIGPSKLRRVTIDLIRFGSTPRVGHLTPRQTETITEWLNHHAGKRT